MSGKSFFPLKQLVVERGIRILRKQSQIADGVVHFLRRIFFSQLIREPFVALIVPALLLVFFPLLSTPRQPQPLFQFLFARQISLISGEDVFERPDPDPAVADEIVTRLPTPAAGDVVKQQITMERILPLLIIVACFIWGRNVITGSFLQLFSPACLLQFSGGGTAAPVNVPAERVVEERITEPRLQLMKGRADLLPDLGAGGGFELFLDLHQERENLQPGSNGKSGVSEQDCHAILFAPGVARGHKCEECVVVHFPFDLVPLRCAGLRDGGFLVGTGLQQQIFHQIGVGCGDFSAVEFAERLLFLLRRDLVEEEAALILNFLQKCPLILIFLVFKKLFDAFLCLLLEKKVEPLFRRFSPLVSNLNGRSFIKVIQNQLQSGQSLLPVHHPVRGIACFYDYQSLQKIEILVGGLKRIDVLEKLSDLPFVPAVSALIKRDEKMELE